MSTNLIDEASAAKVADDFAHRFLGEIKSGAIADNLLNNGQRIDKKYIARQTAAYKRLIESKICDHLYE